MTKPIALITNDDGIESLFLRRLVEALQDEFTTYVVAPKSEKSWIGKAITRYHPVRLEPSSLFKCKAWSLDGNPSDCVNIALGNLLDKSPDIVISGINVSYNLSLPFLFSSGTLAAAIEGSSWNIRSIALSQQVPGTQYSAIKKSNGVLPSDVDDTLSVSISYAKTMALAILEQPVKRYLVHNINFPFPLKKNASIVKTFPTHRHLGSLFSKTDNEHYSFGFPGWGESQSEEGSDHFHLMKGNISHSVLDYTRLAVMGES